MNIIIPLGGKGERFKNESNNILNFTEPKPLIKIYNKPMIFYVLDNLNSFVCDSRVSHLGSVCDSTSPTNSFDSFVISRVSHLSSVCDSTSPTNCRRGVVEDEADTRNYEVDAGDSTSSLTTPPLLQPDLIFIIYYNIEKELFENIIYEKYPNIHLIQLNEQTRGAAETINKGLEQIKRISPFKKSLILDCDTFYTEDILSMYRNITSNAVFYVNNTDKEPLYSYITLDVDKKILKIAEKDKISDNANTGAYCFNDIDVLYEYSKRVITNNITFKNEYYTSCIIQEMINDNYDFKGILLNSNFVFNLGTPKQVKEYIDNTYSFLFDLDGTIILSEDIYYNIWKEILIEYNIILTNEIFNNFISGNSDDYVLNTLLNDKKVDLNTLSNKKDDLFIKNIDHIQLIEGVLKLLNEIKMDGHKLALVTNSNRRITEYILSYYNITHLFDVIIIGNECNHSKPYPDPYIKAIELLNTTNTRSIIFEDSKSGLLSANSVSPKYIIGIETIYSHEELIKFTNITLKNYIDFDYKTIINNNNIHIQLLKEMILKSLIQVKIKDIEINSNKLKGGYISDVVHVDITTYENISSVTPNNLQPLLKNNYISCVLKIENKNKTFLSEMSKKLDLYNREYYFYDFISKYIPVKFPKFYGLIKDNEFNNIGILLEDLNTEEYVLNINLNKEKLINSLNVIDNMALLHTTFWNKNTDKYFKELKKNNNTNFDWSIFINSKWDLFKNKWSNILSKKELEKAEYIVQNFSTITENLSDKNLTLCHGDVKSANIFYKKLGNNIYEPYFIDWQYILLGKGVQDLVFFMIESYDIDKMRLYKNLFKEYYYVKILEYGIQYDKEEYEKDFLNASYYFPFFVAIWFGTLSEDDLIDKDFPLNFIKKLFNFYL